MSTYFKDDNNPYSFMATLISMAKRVDPEAYERYDIRDSRIIGEELIEQIKALFEKYPVLKNVDNRYPEERYGISREIRDNVIEVANRSEDIFAFCMIFLQKLTSYYKWDAISGSFYLKSIAKGFYSLNDNAEDTGIYILPKLPSVGDAHGYITKEDEPRHWNDELYYGLNNRLSGNIYYIDSDHFKNCHGNKFRDYKIRHVLMDWPILKKERIRIAFSPITIEKMVDVPDDAEHIFTIGRQKYFRIKLIDPEALDSKIDVLLEEACRQHVDIIMFPEMLGTERVESGRSMAGVIEALQERTHASPPQIILLPTRSHQGKNILYVYDTSGDMVLENHKQNPFVFGTEGHDLEDKVVVYESLAEDIRNKQPVLNVLHMPIIGRIVFPICVDLLVDEYLEVLMEELKATMVLCPSFSFGKTRFVNTVSIGQRLGCAIVWGNTCSAYFHNRQDEIGIMDTNQMTMGEVFVPFKDGVKKGMLCSCNKECLEEDNGCLFFIDLDFENEKVEVSHHFIKR